MVLGGNIVLDSAHWLYGYALWWRGVYVRATVGVWTTVRFKSSALSARKGIGCDGGVFELRSHYEAFGLEKFWNASWLGRKLSKSTPLHY